MRVLDEAGYDGSGHRARAFDPRWFAERDLVVALDGGHLQELRALAAAAGAPDTVRLLRSFSAAPRDGGLDVADPYYGADSGFATVLRRVEDELPRDPGGAAARRQPGRLTVGQDRLFVEDP